MRSITRIISLRRKHFATRGDVQCCHDSHIFEREVAASYQPRHCCVRDFHFTGMASWHHLYTVALPAVAAAQGYLHMMDFSTADLCAHQKFRKRRKKIISKNHTTVLPTSFGLVDFEPLFKEEGGEGAKGTLQPFSQAGVPELVLLKKKNGRPVPVSIRGECEYRYAQTLRQVDCS